MKIRSGMILALAISAMVAVSAMAWESVGVTDATPVFWACAATEGYKIYHVGGLDNSGEVSSSLQIYDPDSDSWSAGTPPPTPVCGCAADYYDGRIYVAGGFVDNSFNGTDALQIYDIQQDAWSTGASLPDARGGLGGGFIDGFLYTVGGHPTDLFTDDNPTYAYDPQADAWDDSLAEAPLMGYMHCYSLGAAEAIGGMLYIGGHFNAFDTFQYYDPSTDAWTPAPAMPVNAGKMSPLFANAGDMLFDVGGGAGIFAPTVGVYTFNLDSDEWSAYAESLGTATIGNSGVLVGDAIYSFGGTGDDSGFAMNPPPHEKQVVLTVDSVTLDPAEPADVQIGDTIGFTAVVDDGEKKPLPDLMVKFASSEESVGEIHPDFGLFEALAEGQTEVTATYAGVVSDAAIVTVVAGADDDDDDDDADDDDDDTGDDDDDDDGCGCGLSPPL